MPSEAKGGAGGPPLDWVCEMCTAVNFARRVQVTHYMACEGRNEGNKIKVSDRMWVTKK